MKSRDFSDHQPPPAERRQAVFVLEVVLPIDAEDWRVATSALEDIRSVGAVDVMSRHDIGPDDYRYIR